MASRYCHHCNINYPSTLAWDQKCMVPHCKRFTTFSHEDEPDTDWRERLAEAARYPDEDQGWRESTVTLAELSPHPADGNVQVYDVAGRQFIPHHELIDEGYSHLESFSIVFVNGTFYELQGHSRRTYLLLGERHPEGVWWVEEVELGEAPETYPG